MRIIASIVSFILIANTLLAAEFVIPASRIIDWGDTYPVGVDDGIPTRSTVTNCVSEYSVPTDETSDAASAIENCVNGIDSGTVAYLPAGHFEILTRLDINRSDVTLRGAGMGLTTLDCNVDGGISACVMLGGSAPYPASSGTPTWDLGYSKGTTQITIDDATGFNVGDTIVVDVQQDGTLVNNAGTTFISRDSGVRTFQQAVEIMAINGNVLTIDPPLYYDYSTFSNPSVYRTTTVRNTGLESITVDCADDTSDYCIGMWGMNNAWLYKVEAYKGNRADVDLRHITKFEITKSEIHESQAYATQSYGIELGHNASAGHIYNNYIHSMATGIVTYGSSSGNVIDHNLIKDCKYSTTTWMVGAVTLHGAHPFMTLFEGNVMWALEGENMFGSSSHITVFRNRLFGYQLIDTPPSPLDTYTKTNSAWALEILGMSKYYNIIGNILGDNSFHTQYLFDGDGTCSPNAGIYNISSESNCAIGTTSDSSVWSTQLDHANYNYVTDSILNCDDTGETGCQSATNTDYPTDSIPVSLIYATTPSFFGSLSSIPVVDPSSPGSFSLTNLPVGYWATYGVWPDEISSGSAISVGAGTVNSAGAGTVNIVGAD